jgi:hypothetical protein
MEFFTKKGNLIYSLAQEGHSLEVICDTMPATISLAKVIQFLRCFRTIPKPLYELLHDDARLFQYMSAHGYSSRQIKILFGKAYEKLAFKYGTPKKRYGFRYWGNKFQREIGIKVLRERGKTYQEIGQIFGITRQRAEQIHRECLALTAEDIISVETKRRRKEIS